MILDFQVTMGLISKLTKKAQVRTVSKNSMGLEM